MLQKQREAKHFKEDETAWPKEALGPSKIKSETQSNREADTECHPSAFKYLYIPSVNPSKKNKDRGESHINMK